MSKTNGNIRFQELHSVDLKVSRNCEKWDAITGFENI